jgi:pre-mRNA-processing factor 39
LFLSLSADDIDGRLFERGANCVGLDFLAHPFWDKYIEFEERLEAFDKIFAILGRVIHIPMHQYARYFERYRQLAQGRPLNELAPTEILSQYRSEIEAAASQPAPGAKSEAETERDLRLRLDTYHLEVFSKTQTETTKRWTYESEIKRPYFHVTELDEGQLANWKRYLDFEEAEGSYARTVFLYERCLVTCAHYDEFWLRYARWMSEQPEKEEEVRNIYQGASTVYVPIAYPTVRLHYAYFEEMTERIDIARDIHEAILFTLPNHVETIVSLANLSRRHGKLEDAIEVYKSRIETPGFDAATKAALVAEWAILIWRVKGRSEEARQVFQSNQQNCLDSRAFWTRYLLFELEQPTTPDIETVQHERIKKVVDDLRHKSTLPAEAVKELVQNYMVYLLERGTKTAAKEYITLDREVHGPASVSPTNKIKEAPKVVPAAPQPDPTPDAAAYAYYQQQQAQIPVPNGGVPTQQAHY